MTSTNDVFRKIKEISKREMNPRPTVQLSEVARELSLVRDQILPEIMELKDLRLIQLDTTLKSPSSVKLTLLGCTVNR